MEAVFDLEGDSLTPTKIHCISAMVNGKLFSTTDYDKMRSFFLKADVLIGHNITLFDIPVVERILGIEVKAKLIDTLALSWYLEPNLIRHGLDPWGEKLGIKKPEIVDWENLSIEEYIHRCEEDVKINTKLWNRFWDHLMEIYGDEHSAMELVDYLSFKMGCAEKQERSGWKLDVDLCEEKYLVLSSLKEEKVRELSETMPSKVINSTKTRPAKPFKTDGTFSVLGCKWFALLEEKGLPENYLGEIDVFKEKILGNPNSHIQIKEWLWSLGWKPETFKYDKKDGKFRELPQINKEFGGGICDSIKKLYPQAPELELLDGLSVLTHRISILKGFLAAVDDNGYIKAQIGGLTNTLRFKHRTIVNLPKANVAYGDIIRGVLIAPEGKELCGSDQSSLEDRTKQHYIWDYDPEYVKTMLRPDFDPHLTIAVAAGMMSEGEAQGYKDGRKEFLKKFGPVRHKAKTVNYSATYGAFPRKIAQTLQCSLKEATALFDAYWKVNWSVKKVAESCKVKTVKGQKWLFNPVSNLWYSLRAEKDRFSTLNQGTGTYCFDRWVMKLMMKGLYPIGQFHDECIWAITKGNRERCSRVLKWAVKEVNKDLELNRELDIDIQYGDRYSEIH